MHGTEPVTIDRVVECRYAGGAGEMRGYVRTTVKPVVFGVPTNDGGMAFMVAPDYCGKKGTNTEYVPFLMWSDKVGDFSFFTGFLDEQSLTEPNASLHFVDTTLRPVDVAEYAKWQRSTSKSVIPPKPNPFLGDMRGPSVDCVGMLRLAIPEGARDKVAREWPVDHPNYWIPSFALKASIERPLQKEMDAERSAYPEGRGVPKRLTERAALYVVGDREYFVDKGRSVPDGTTIKATVPLQFPGRGIINCGVNQPHAPLIIEDTYVIDNAQTPFVRILYNNSFIMNDTDLFVGWDFGFNIERGDPAYD